MANRPATEKKTKLTILVNEEILNAIEITAKAEGRSMSSVAGMVLKDWVSENEKPTIKPHKGQGEK